MKRRKMLCRLLLLTTLVYLSNGSPVPEPDAAPDPFTPVVPSEFSLFFCSYFIF
jgi:hypothetical protein